MSRVLLITTLLLMVVFTAGAVVRPYCVICRRQVPQRYLKGADNRVYCSKKCFEKTLPKCANCNLICRWISLFPAHRLDSCKFFVN